MTSTINYIWLFQHTIRTHPKQSLPTGYTLGFLSYVVIFLWRYSHKEGGKLEQARFPLCVFFFVLKVPPYLNEISQKQKTYMRSKYGDICKPSFLFLPWGDIFFRSCGARNLGKKSWLCKILDAYGPKKVRSNIFQKDYIYIYDIIYIYMI